MTYLTFTTRDTYIAARAQWRANYQAHSELIRETRRAFRLAQKEFSKADVAVESRVWKLAYSDPKYSEYFRTLNVVEELRTALRKLRKEATELVDMRISMKEKAREVVLSTRVQQ